MTFRRQHGHVRRTRGWWMIDHLQFSIDDRKRLVRKRVIAKLTLVLPEHGCMLLPPASVMEAQREYMAGVNEDNRAVLFTLARKPSARQTEPQPAPFLGN